MIMVMEMVKRSNDIKDSSLRRLKLIIGQVNGIYKMVDDDRDCEDILIQISAIRSALKNLGEEILFDHMKHCMINDIKNNKLESIDEVVDLCRRLM